MWKCKVQNLSKIFNHEERWFWFSKKFVLKSKDYSLKTKIEKNLYTFDLLKWFPSTCFLWKALKLVVLWAKTFWLFCRTENVKQDTILSPIGMLWELLFGFTWGMKINIKKCAWLKSSNLGDERCFIFSFCFKNKGDRNFCT